MAEPVVLGDRYELGDVIGRGGMAEVRRARDTRLGRDVAIKQLRADLAGDPTFQARFRREAQSAAGLNHPTIVAVYDTGARTDPATGLEVPYIVMELVEGHTLRDVLRDGRRILPERALELTAGVLDALSYSHKAGIIHRDIKPANVMLTRTGAVKVMDFGIARAVSDTAASMTQTAAVIGTAQYLSPEQARGETVDHRSDIYSAGCLLYELLTGRPPFQGDSPVSVAYQHVREMPVAPSQVDPDDDMITPAMDAIVMKALAKDPAHRYQDAQEMRSDIQRLLAGQEVTAALPAAAAVAATQVIPRTAVAPATIVQPYPASQPTPTAEPTAPTVAVAPALDRAAVEADPGPGPAPRRRSSPFLAAFLTLLVAGLIAGGVWFYLDWQNKNKAQVVQQVEVPAVLNYPQLQAETRIGEVGLKAVVKQENGPAETKGLVVKQSPNQKVKVNPGSEVTITVNAGPETVTIPAGLKGRNVDEVTRTLQGLGFTVKRNDATGEPAAAKAGDVVDLSPGEGQPAAKGSTVTLSVARGLATVPNLRGMSLDAAQAELTRRGFTAVTRVEENSDQPAGTVFAQNVEPNKEVPKTTPLELKVSKGQPTYVIPGDLVGKPEAEVKALLEAQGLRVVVNRTAGEQAAGTVLSTDPAPGTEVRKDKSTVVILTVSSGPSIAPTTAPALTPTPTQAPTAPASPPAPPTPPSPSPTR